jgi:hypothetical protein
MAAPNPFPAQPTKKSWLPTRKWVTAQVVALGAIATSWVDSGWDDTETHLVIGWVIQAVATYAIANRSTRAEGGVPLKGTGL